MKFLVIDDEKKYKNAVNFDEGQKKLVKKHDFKLVLIVATESSLGRAILMGMAALRRSSMLIKVAISTGKLSPEGTELVKTINLRAATWRGPDEEEEREEGVSFEIERSHLVISKNTKNWEAILQHTAKEN